MNQEIQKSNLIEENATQRLKAILDNQNEAIICLLENGYISFVNRAFCNLLEITENQLLGNHIALFNDAFLEILEETKLLQQPTHKELSFQQSDKLLWFKWICAPIINDLGQITEFQISGTEITNQKQAEETLQKKELSFRNSIEIAPEGIFILDIDANCLYANQAAKHLLGYSRSEILRHSFSDFLPEGLSFEDFIRQSDNEKHSVETFFVRKDNHKIPVLLDFIRNEDTFICFSKDISTLKETEKALKKAKRKAEYAASVKSQFLSTMSHEIRTPLNAVIAITYLLLQESPKPEQVPNLNTLKFSAENLLALINDILDFDKIESNKITFENVDFHLNSLLMSIKEGLNHKAIAKGIEIHLNIAQKAEKFILSGDVVRLSQIFTNLIDNAIKFTQKGSVSIIANLIEEDDTQCVFDFAVEDTGIGIEKNKLEIIFERFTQASSDTTRIFGGTGLGLAITKKLLSLQGSHIEVQSEVGKGSKFFFKLAFPKSKNQSLNSFHVVNQNISNLSEQNLKGASILLVEDNEINRLVATQFLDKWNAKIDYADNGKMAVQKILEQDYDVILMDLQMPIMDGYDTTQEIRALEGKYATLPIIALTASAMIDVKKKVFAAGMNDYITKPFNPNELYSKIVKQMPIHINEEDLLEKWENLLNIQENIIVEESFLNYDKVMEVSGGNKLFIRQYNDLAIQVFKDFPQDFQKALQGKNSEQLSKISHHIRATLAFLEFNELDRELANAKKIISQIVIDQKTVQQSIHKVQELCQKALLFIEKKNL